MTRYSGYGDLKIGTSVPGLTSLIDLTYGGDPARVPPPKVEFVEASAFGDLAGGGIKRLGWPAIRWTWDRGISYTAQLALRAYVTTAVQHTSPIYVQSPDEMGDLRKWRGVMRWPTRGLGYQSFEYLAPFTIEFFSCEEAFDWWDPAGVGLSAIAAWRAVASTGSPWAGGPASYAASLVDLTGNGHDLTEGNGAVPWTQANGWGFVDTDAKYLDTGLAPATDQSWSMFVQYAGYPQSGGADYLAGFYAAADRMFGCYLNSSSSSRSYGNGGIAGGAPNPVAGNMAVVGDDGYFDGVSESLSLGAWGGAAGSVYIGARNYTGTKAHITANIKALVFFDDDPAAVAAQAAAIDAAMGEL